jgi:hypothetical protein
MFDHGLEDFGDFGRSMTFDSEGEEMHRLIADTFQADNFLKQIE